MNPLSRLKNAFARRSAMEETRDQFKIFTGYCPSFTTYEGSVYEMAITRAAIDAFARHASKLKPEVIGPKNSANPRLKRFLALRPNPWQTASQFLYQLATMLMVHNNVIILPIEDFGYITGYQILDNQNFEVRAKNGRLYLTYELDNVRKAIEFERVGIMVRHQNGNPFFGESNGALRTTLQLMSIQDQGIIEGIKSGGTVRFAAKLTEVLKDDTVNKARERFVNDNLKMNNGGLVLYDNKFSDFRQLESKPVWIDDKQSELIKSNVYEYFGVSSGIIRNDYTEDEYNAFYEGLIEPFALQLGQVLTLMTFTDKELSFGNEIMFSANRLQYASNMTKLQISSAMLDRGVLSRNEVREIWQLPGIGPEGDEYVIRGEYISTDELGEENDNAIQTEG